MNVDLNLPPKIDTDSSLEWAVRHLVSHSVQRFCAEIIGQKYPRILKHDRVWDQTARTLGVWGKWSVGVVSAFFGGPRAVSHASSFEYFLFMLCNWKYCSV